MKLTKVRISARCIVVHMSESSIANLIVVGINLLDRQNEMRCSNVDFAVLAASI